MTWPDAAPIVEVEWIDSHSRGGWRLPDQWDDALADRVGRCSSVGYLYRRDADRVVLMQSQADAGTWADAIDIPAAAVLSVRIIEAGRERA